MYLYMYVCTNTKCMRVRMPCGGEDLKISINYVRMYHECTPYSCMISEAVQLEIYSNDDRGVRYVSDSPTSRVHGVNRLG